jgi:hypothetical protein
MSTPGDEIDRRRLIKAVIILGVAIPILIEVITFAGLVSHSFGGGEGAATETPTPDAGGVGVGDQLLEATPENETLTTATVITQDESWVVQLSVSVTNTGTEPYELGLQGVTSDEGTRVNATAQSGAISPRTTRTVTGAWSLPAGERPATLHVTVARGSGAPATTYTVELAPVPVSR